MASFFYLCCVGLMFIGCTSSQKKECGGQLSAMSTEQSFKSPNYPANYPNNVECEWIISASQGHSVHLSFNPFFTESCCDYVQVYDGSESLGQYRGRKSDLRFASKTSSLRVALHSDDSINGMGFSATFSEKDNDECAAGTDNCALDADCLNTEGSYVCTCKAGYHGNGTTCIELNECNDAIHPPNCHAHAHCVDKVNAYQCECLRGYTGSGEMCTDIDECGLEHPICDHNAICSNSEGSFTCTCAQGYSGDGVQCQDIDECSIQKHDCSSDIACQNTPGSYLCQCPAGFTGNGFLCQDVDECKQEPPICGNNAQCINSEGDYHCQCAAGYAGNGRTCLKAFEVLCLPGSISVRVMKIYYEEKGIGLDQLHFSDFSCKGVVDPRNPEVWVFNLTTLSSCSTIHVSNETHLIYMNRISNVLHGDHVYVGSAQINAFACTYKRKLDDLSLFSFNYGVYHDIANITAPSNLGVFIAKMNHFTDASYTMLDTNEEYRTSDTIFIKIELETSDPSLNLVLDRCWITPTPNIKHPLLFNFIEHGCAADNSAKVQVTQSGKGPVARFQSQVFAFVDFNSTFLHCSLLICPWMAGRSCEPKCVNGVNSNKYSMNGGETMNFSLQSLKQRRKRGAARHPDEEILSMGPFHRKKRMIANFFDTPITFVPLAVASLLALICLALVITVTRQKRKPAQLSMMMS